MSSLSLLYGPKSYCIGICHWFKSLILKMGRISFGYSVHFDISFKQFLDGNISNLHIQFSDMKYNFLALFRYDLWFSYIMCISISFISPFIMWNHVSFITLVHKGNGKWQYDHFLWLKNLRRRLKRMFSRLYKLSLGYVRVTSVRKPQINDLTK